MTTTTRIGFILSLSTLIAACSGHDPMSTSIGAAGGSVTTQSGITLRVPAGALSQPTELRIVESQPRDGAMARVELEPRGLALAVPATLSFKVEDGNVKLAEVEHGPEGEVRTELQKARHTGEVEVEVEHLGEVEMEHGLTCDVACDAGFECDDGVCKAHDETETHVEHPAGPDDTAPAPSTGPAAGGTPGTTTSCPAGMELDPTDGTCKAHGGSSGSGKA
jgi:hypothetical protein